MNASVLAGVRRGRRYVVTVDGGWIRHDGMGWSIYPPDPDDAGAWRKCPPKVSTMIVRDVTTSVTGDPLLIAADVATPRRRDYVSRILSIVPA